MAAIPMQRQQYRRFVAWSDIALFSSMGDADRADYGFDISVYPPNPRFSASCPLQVARVTVTPVTMAARNEGASSSALESIVPQCGINGTPNLNNGTHMNPVTIDVSAPYTL
jgi:hypothetical protein